MVDEVLRTDVDDFMELVKRRGKMTIKDAAHALGVTEKTVERWTDFLVEERILDTEYKFTTQYIYLNADRSGSEFGHHNIDTKEEYCKINV